MIFPISPIIANCCRIAVSINIYDVGSVNVVTCISPPHSIGISITCPICWQYYNIANLSSRIAIAIANRIPPCLYPCITVFLFILFVASVTFKAYRVPRHPPLHLVITNATSPTYRCLSPAYRSHRHPPLHLVITNVTSL